MQRVIAKLGVSKRARAGAGGRGSVGTVVAVIDALIWCLKCNVDIRYLSLLIDWSVYFNLI